MSSSSAAALATLPSIDPWRSAGAEADLPPDAPLAMPTQSFDSPPEWMRRLRWPLGWRPAALIFLTAMATGFAVFALYKVLSVDTVGPLDFVVLGVFAPLFAWTAFSFASALAGLLASGRDNLGLHASSPMPALSTRTAILSPIYNEAPDDLAARLQAMWRSLEAAGAAESFDIFILSDTTEPAIQRAEHDRFAALRRRLPAQARVYYRHRPRNIDRKAGNIADWVRRFGADYDFMVVLDADSLMEGETLVRLAGAMERHPRVGLIQTAPVVINRHSLFARTEQFASRLYGPTLARGLAWWSGDQGNYWGHNAIIRVAAFAGAAGLPHLPGPRPFGGHILSHDFVEAALMRRAGWEVRLAPSLRGSYEESPPTLGDAIARDRRWCQGNLQHLKVLRARGLAPISRLHLIRGVASYLTAPLWLALLATSALLGLKPDWGVGDPEIADRQLSAPGHETVSVLAVFAVSMAFLLAPKLIAFCAMLTSSEDRRRFGGAGKALASMLLEIVLSALLAPVLMLNQVWALISILSGRDSGWAAQHREEDDLTLEEAANRHLGDTAVGVALAVSAFGVSTDTFLWMLPVILGMVFCIPLAALSSRRDLGEMAARAGLLVTPEEFDPPPVVRAFNALRAQPPHELAMPVLTLVPATAAAA
ncbi:MAG: glucans biosynthesis glucosyltransferase MdoH [Caulobacteraceae bacterium]